MFLFPPVKHLRTDEGSLMSDGYLSNLMGGEASTLINNAWARMGEREYVILAGLTEQQKNYLALPEGTRAIEIQKVSEVYPKLSPLVGPKRQELRCATSDILKALFLAQKQRKSLVIDESAPPLRIPDGPAKGIIVIEEATDASPVIAINFASSIDANILLVSPLSEDEERNVPKWIQTWKERGDETGLQELKNTVSTRIGNTSCRNYEYATFFTEGLPYSLVLGNPVPSSYVNLSLKPDLFIINNIIFANRGTFHSGVVFSPTFFPDEETEWLCNFLRQNNYYLRALAGRDATLANFDFHAQFFPYEILHICSHGGEVEGYEMSERFSDRDGTSHVVEFDEVIGLTPALDRKGMVQVHRKAFPRRLDGFEWRSDELKRQNFPDHVYSEMWKCILESRGRRKVKGRISMSCSIACVDSIHQGQFHTVASHTSPLVFNNTCWSWDEVSKFFLACGARAYIGTLWAIDNEAAVVAAQTFYKNVFSEPVLSAFHKAVKALDNTNSKDIYIYWGLHFTNLPPAQSYEDSEERVLSGLMRAGAAWSRKIASTRNSEIRRNSIKILNSITRELLANFGSKKIEQFVTEIKERNVSRAVNEEEANNTRSSMDFPPEYSEAKAPKLD
jgi:hypothetical protein